MLVNVLVKQFVISGGTAGEQVFSDDVDCVDGSRDHGNEEGALHNDS